MSADEKEESPSRPLGTSTGVFWQKEDAVVARLDLFRVMEFLYEDEAAAEAALGHFHDSLLADDQISIELRDRYSLEGMLDFIARFVIRENVLGLRWLTRLRITPTGLQFEMPDGQWSDIHIESVSNTYNWKRVSIDPVAEAADLETVAANANTMGPLTYTACSHFGLSFDANWEGVGRVYREDGLSLWFPDD